MKRTSFIAMDAEALAQDRPRRDRAGRSRRPARARQVGRAAAANEQPRPLARRAPPPASPRSRRCTSGRWRRPRSRGCSTSSTSTASAREIEDDAVRRRRSRVLRRRGQRRRSPARDEIDALLRRAAGRGLDASTRLDKTMLQILRAGDLRAARPRRRADRHRDQRIRRRRPRLLRRARGEVRQRRARRGGEGGALSGREPPSSKPCGPWPTTRPRAAWPTMRRCSKSAAKRWS